MKDLFTYPYNSGSYYIDPAHIGDGTYGVSYRVDELLKGNYRDYFGATPFYQHGTTWQDTAPIFSRYINYYENNKSQDNLSQYDFWYLPTVELTTLLNQWNIASSDDTEASWGVSGSVMTLDTTSNHALWDGIQMKFSAVTNGKGWGQLSVGGYKFYAKREAGHDSTQVEFYLDENLTQPAIPYHLGYSNNVTTSSDTNGDYIFTHAAGELVQDMPVSLANFDGTVSDPEYNWDDGTTYYVQSLTSTTSKLSRDLAGTDILAIVGLEEIEPSSFYMNADDTIDVEFDVSEGISDLLTDYTRQNITLDPDYDDEINLNVSGNFISDLAISGNGLVTGVVHSTLISGVRNYYFRAAYKENDEWTYEVSNDLLGSTSTYFDRIYVEFDETGDTAVVYFSTYQTINGIKVMQRSGNNWSLLQTISYDGFNTGSNKYPMDISSDGLSLIVGDDLYTRTTKSSNFTSAFNFARSHIGAAINQDGTIVAIGDSGNVWVYRYNAGWSTTPDETISTSGRQIKLTDDGNLIVDLYAGNVFEYSASTWTQVLALPGTTYERGSVSNTGKYIIFDNANYIKYGSTWVDDASPGIGTYLGGLNLNVVRGQLDNNGNHVWLSANSSTSGKLWWYSQVHEHLQIYSSLSGTNYLSLLSYSNGKGRYQLFTDEALTTPLTWQSAYPNIATGLHTNDENRHTIIFDAGIEPEHSTTGEITEDIPASYSSTPYLCHIDGWPNLNIGVVRPHGDELYSRYASNINFIAGGGPSWDGIDIENQIETYGFYKPGYSNATTNVALTAGDYSISLTGNGFFIDFNVSQFMFLRGAYRYDFYRGLMNLVPFHDIQEQQETIVDDGTQWRDFGDNISKRWPEIAPRKAAVFYNMPSSKTTSAFGTKYVLPTGRYKWSIEFEYPPLTEAQFKEIYAVAHAVQGVANPFYLPLTYNGEQILWKSATTSPEEIRFRKEEIDNNTNNIIEEGLKTFLVDGFEANQVNALVAGDVINLEPNINGGLSVIVNTVDANVYGETQMTIASPLEFDHENGELINRTVDACVVTLADNDFNYVRRLDGLYDLTVRFNLDKFED